MTGTLIHIPTGRLIHEDKDVACVEKKQSEKAVLDITTPNGRSIFSIRKLVDDMSDGGSSEREAA